jgi:hypothetical protein
MTKYQKYRLSKKATNLGGYRGRNYFGLDLGLVVDLASKGLNSD